METSESKTRFSRRTKCLEVSLLADGKLGFETSLVDESVGGQYEMGECGSLVIHHFAMSGTASIDDLRLETLEVRAKEHPFPQCPFILPATKELVGLSLLSGWRTNVLQRFGRAAGCTHLTTLLLGLSEVTTLMYFQRMNQRASYGPEGRASGAWIAGSIDLGQNLGDACHALRADGPVIQQAKDFLQHRDHPATDPPQGIASH